MNIEHIAPADIEKRSFEIITKELEAMNVILPEDKAFLIKRAIHTTADFDYAGSLVFSESAVSIMAELSDCYRHQYGTFRDQQSRTCNVRGEGGLLYG